MGIMGIKEFKENHKEFCDRYNETLDLYYRCAEYLEIEIRTPVEIEKFCKMLPFYAKSLSLMMIEYKTINNKPMTNRLVLGGFIQYNKASW